MSEAATFDYEEWMQVAFQPDVSLIPRAVDRLRNSLASQGAPVDTIDGLRLAVTEALTNAVVHGDCPPGTPEVRLRWAWDDAGLAIEISEPGYFAPPPTWADLPEDPLCESGRGGFLITQEFDEWAHLNAAGRHTLRLRKRLGPPRFPATVAAELEQTLAAMTEDLSASYETLSALFKLAEALATTQDLGAFVEHALHLRALTEADACHVRLRDAEGRLALLGARGSGVDAPASIPLESDAIEAQVFRAGLERTFDERTLFAADDPLRGVRGVGFVCPVHFQSRQLGVCVLVRHRAGDYFTAAQLSLARTTAEFLGIACANAEFQAQRMAQLRAQRELEIAAQIQRSLVPTEFPRRRDWRVHGVCENAEEAGGDFFDVLEVEDGLLLVIADVMGKGMPAALLAVVLRTAVRAHAAHAATPDQLLDSVSTQIAADLDRLGMFITAQAVFLPAQRPEIVYANAGHCPIAVLGSDPAAGSDLRVLDEGGLPLGVSQTERYVAARATLRPGERLLLITDGFLEAVDSRGRQLGLDGLCQLARGLAQHDLAAACAELLAQVKQRDSGRSLVDDRTLLAVEFLS